MQKSTEELVHALKESKNITDYLNDNEKELLKPSLPEYFAQLLEEKALEKADVIRASGLNQVYGYQILSGNRKPLRDKLLALAFGFQLNVAETQELLKYAEHFQLYARSQRDSIIMFSLEHHLEIFVCNELLDELGEKLLISVE